MHHEIGQRQGVDLGVAQQLAQGGIVAVTALVAMVTVRSGLAAVLAVVGQIVLQAGFFLGGQPLGVCRPVLQVVVEDDAQDTGGWALDEKQPLPAVQAVDAIHVLQDGAAQGAGYDGHAHDGGQKDGDHPAAAGRGVPVGEVEDDAGEKARLERAQQKAGHVELHGRGDPGHGGGDDAPDHHDAHQGLAGADFLQQQVAGHFKQKVANEEQARAKAVGGVAKIQRLLHLDLRVANVDAVEVGDHVAQQQQGQQTPADLGVQRVVCSDVGAGRLGSGSDALNSGCAWIHLGLLEVGV